MGLHLLLLLIAGSTASYHADAVRVDVLLDSIAKQSGQTIACAKEVAGEPVIADFEARPVQEVLDHLAEVTNSKWLIVNGVSTLSRTPKDLKQLQAEDQQRTISLWDAMLTKQIAQGTTDHQWLSTWAALTNDQSNTPDDIKTYLSRATSNPATWAVAAYLQGISPKTLYSIPVGQRVVFSDAPTQMQRALPAICKKATAHLKEQLTEIWKERAKNEMKPESFMGEGDMPAFAINDPRVGFGKVVLAVTHASTSNLSYQLLIVNPSGQAIMRHRGDFPSRLNSYRLSPPHKGEELKIPPLTTTYANLAKIGVNMSMGTTLKINGKDEPAGFAVQFGEADGKPYDNSVQKVLADPVSNDPVGPTVGCLLRQALAGSGKPILAEVDDVTVLYAMRQVSFGTLKTKSDVLDMLSQASVNEADRVPLAEAIPNPDWMLYRPEFPSRALATRLDRAALKDLIGAIETNGGLTLNDAADYYRRTRISMPFGSLSYCILSKASDSVNGSMIQGVFNESLPFLMSMSEAQWSDAARTGLTLDRMTPEQQRALEHWVYNYFSFQHLAERPGVSFFEIAKQPLRFEPTELFPNGVPSNVVVRVTRVKTSELITKTDLGYQATESPASVGLLLAIQDLNKGLLAHYTEQARKHRIVFYRPATKTGYKIEVSLAEGLSPTLQASESSAVKGTELGDLSLLPAALREQIEAARIAAIERNP